MKDDLDPAACVFHRLWFSQVSADLLHPEVIEVGIAPAGKGADGFLPSDQLPDNGAA